MSPHLVETLNWLRANGPATVQQIYDASGAGVGRTAFDNRMASLRALGLVTRTKTTAREWLWSVVESNGT